MQNAKLKPVLIIALVIFLLDHLTKYLIVSRFAVGDSLALIPHFFDIVHVQNEGAAFGVLSQWSHRFKDVFFYAVFLVALGFLFYFLKALDEKKRASLFAVGLIFGGAFGNIVDRWLRGSVVDFLSVHWRDKIVRFDVLGHYFSIPLTWPAFNVADSAITVGVGLLLIMSLRESK